MTTDGRPFIRSTASLRSSTVSTRGWRTTANSCPGNCTSVAITTRVAVSPVASETMWSSTTATRGTLGFVAMLETYEGRATIEKVAALARRRGFVYPSSDIYGGLGSSYDYGHYGVLLKQNVKNEWQRAMVQEREDIVLIDSAIILNPQVWVASGHLAGFSDPLVDCRTCKLRFRADHLAQSACGRKPSKRPGETPDCDLTEARQFNLMFETSIGPV